MVDLLIRDVPADVVTAIDARAKHLGLSRSEYLRRQLAGAARPGVTVTVSDLARFAETCSDLDNPDVMARAWQ